MQILDHMDQYYYNRCRDDFKGYATVEELSQALEQSSQKVKLLEKKMKQLKASKSFRAGRALTYIPRKIRDAVKK